MTYRKPFNPAVYKKCDALAKEAMLKILKEKGHEIVSSEEKKRIDIVSKKNDVLYYHEGEVKLSWENDEWPAHFDNVRIPSRKKGLVRQHTSNLYFYVFNTKANYYWFIKGEDLSDSLLDVPEGRWNEKNKEEFYVVPLEKAILMKA